ncbi:MAG: hypothetical protein U0K95_03590 [Eubacterium sp.]|nr:hypothetical protein [Eubacterium sp.]
MHFNFKSLYQKENFLKRLILVILAVILMGFCLSFLVLADLGTDPCTLMNLAISKKLGMSLGNWQALFNCFLFIFVILFGVDQIGFGTLANMFLVGYSLDFFTWLWVKTGIALYFDSAMVRYITFPFALLFFVFVAAVYMDVELGTSPYDAMPFIISKKLTKIPFRVIRMGYDFLVIFVGWLFGGKVQIATILMALLLGPVISTIGKKLAPLLNGRA